MSWGHHFHGEADLRDVHGASSSSQSSLPSSTSSAGSLLMTTTSLLSAFLPSSMSMESLSL